MVVITGGVTVVVVVAVVRLLAPWRNASCRRRLSREEKRVENKFNHPIGLVDTFLLEWPWANSVPHTHTQAPSHTHHPLILCLNVETLHYLDLSLCHTGTHLHAPHTHF